MKRISGNSRLNSRPSSTNRLAGINGVNHQADSMLSGPGHHSAREISTAGAKIQDSVAPAPHEPLSHEPKNVAMPSKAVVERFQFSQRGSQLLANRLRAIHQLRFVTVKISHIVNRSWEP